VQVGLSQHDAWRWQALLLSGYRLGAPPSRTNPAGQPWGYAVFDPAHYRSPDGRPGPVLRLVAARMDAMFARYDGLRIDHPHGWVCPWVYREDRADPFAAVRAGARLFDSPDLPDHPALGAYAIARPDQIRRDRPRHADDRVAELEPGQVDRYAVLFDAVVESARRHGRDPHDLACEVLSTLPYPLARVLARHGLGRFRVAQKADLHDPADVYRSENARPEDWVLLGNHDTAPLWACLDAWNRDGTLAARAGHIADRLAPDAGARAELARRLASDPGALAQAQLAELFACPARHVLVYFTDLFGLREPYNRPGTVGPDNWSLRLPGDFAAVYRERVARGRALSLPAALALALASRGERERARELEACARDLPEELR
jgi:4-alpha-glucanotransferase